jgi:hypothetical protein
MKRLLLILILTLSFQTLIKADDIGDFEIEGMSVGDSLLDHMSKSEIKKAEENSTIYPDEKYIVIFSNQASKKYDMIEITYSNKNKDYLIDALVGKVLYPDNYEKCTKDKKNIVKEFKKIFKNAKLDEHIQPHFYDNKSTVNASDFFIESGGMARVSCTDYTEEMFKEHGWKDTLKISMSNEEFSQYLSDL